MSNLPIAGAFGLGGPELIVIAVIVLLLFGGSQLPKLSKGLAESFKELRKAFKDDDHKT